MARQTSRARFTADITTAIVVVLLSFPATASAMELGRLFYSPAERVLMDRSRALPVRCLTMKGIVTKTRRNRRIWLAHDEASEDGGEETRIGIDDMANSDGSILLWVTPEETIALKAGETRDVVKRETRDAFDSDRGSCGGRFASVVK